MRVAGARLVERDEPLRDGGDRPAAEEPPFDNVPRVVEAEECLSGGAVMLWLHAIRLIGAMVAHRAIDFHPVVAFAEETAEAHVLLLDLLAEGVGYAGE